MGQHYLFPTSSHLPIHSKALRYGPKATYTYPGVATPALPWGHRVQVYETGPVEKGPSPTTDGPLPFFLLFL